MIVNLKLNNYFVTRQINFKFIVHVVEIQKYKFYINYTLQDGHLLYIIKDNFVLLGGNIESK